ncbi:MAG: DNA topoisomerase III, partial [Planctomycetes bacterium]|nr:DNA topoisomerase III [Planctomycetota bacterium]
MKLVITEKPSVARDLAAFLGAGRRGDGFLEGKGYKVAWALGHLVGLCEPEDYDPSLKRWALETLPFVPREFRLKVIGDAAARRQFDVLRRLLKSADEIICATDAGREGELIFRYILEQAGLAHRPFRRLWLNSLNPEAIRRAFQNLRPGADYDRLYAAARCRSQADWIVGLNATRNFTVRHGGKGLLWSAGRVQTPVLSLIVNRDDEIRAFRPETFYEVWTTYRETAFKHSGDRFARREEAQGLLDRVAGRGFAIVKIEPKRRVEQPPQLYDLTGLQRDMNRRYGLSADRVLKAAQKLYEAKAITYPRTDSRYITGDMKPEVREILSRLQPHKPAEIGKLSLDKLPFTARIVNDRKVSDHHAILPTGAWPASLRGAEAKVFDAVVVRLIAAFYPPCIKLLTTVDGEADKIPFRATGVQILDPGWTELYPRRSRLPGGTFRDGAKESKLTTEESLDETSDETSAPSEEGPARQAGPTQPLPEFKIGERGPHE